MYTIDERTLRENCRHFSENIDYERVIMPIVEEAVQLDITPQIGEEVTDDTTLLSGGTFTDCHGVRRTFAGLNKAAAYYVYARLLRNPNGFLSSTGFRQSVDNYSNYVEYKERESTIIAVKEAADSYMADCIAYVNSVQSLRDKLPCNRRRRRTSISAIVGN